MDFDSPDYQRFLAETARHCRSCPECSDVPCDACMAGGICDAACVCYERDVWDSDVEDDDG